MNGSCKDTSVAENDASASLIGTDTYYSHLPEPCFSGFFQNKTKLLGTVSFSSFGRTDGISDIGSELGIVVIIFQAVFKAAEADQSAVALSD